MNKTTRNVNEKTSVVDAENFTPLPKEVMKKLQKVSLSKDQLGILCDAYDDSQKLRIALGNQISALDRNGKGLPEDAILTWYKNNLENMESTIKKALDKYLASVRIGRWLKSIYGIGPVFAGKLIYNFDVTKCEHYGQFHSYAGLNDNNRPWLGVEKSKAIVSKLMDEGGSNLAEIRYLVNNPEKVSDSDDELLSLIIKKFDANDGHYRSKLIDSIIKLDVNSETKIGYIKQAVCDNLHNVSKIGDVKVPVRKNKPVDDYVIMKIANETKWSISYLNSSGRDKKSQMYTEDSLTKACAKIPYNKDLKKTCYLIADSFVHQSNREGSLYGRLYKERKAYELAKNEAGDYANEAKRALDNKSFANKEVKSIYESGKLPLGHIESRARRYAVKIFIAHVFEAMYYYQYGKDAPNPYPLEYMGHVDYIAPEVDFREVE